ncbi:MAG: poly-gamma-glutamate hydrolase family protein [Caldilineaceae bacterium]
MATYEATVKRAFLSQETLFTNGEHCSADGNQLATIGCAVGQQIRVKSAIGELALYTVSEIRQERPETIVRMSQKGRTRLATAGSEIPAEFAATVDAQVPHPTHSDECAEANSEFVERLTDDGAHTGLVVIAPHGGDIEPSTDLQAERVAAQFAMQNVSCWRCKGWRQGGGAYERWHITSPDLHEASFPLLNTIINRSFSYAVAFHGFEEPYILIGGGADAMLKCQIKSAIELVLADSGIDVRIATEADNFNGDNPHNIVNRLAGGNGIQIEQSLAARQNHWQRIADAVTSVFRCRL